MTVYVRDLFKKMTDKKVEQIADGLAEAIVNNGRELPSTENGNMFDVIKNIRKSVLRFKLKPIENEYITFEGDFSSPEYLECVRYYKNDDFPFDIYNTDWKEVANMEYIENATMPNSKDSYINLMIALLLAMTESGYTYEEAIKNQKQFWKWIDSVDKMLERGNSQ